MSGSHSPLSSGGASTSGAGRRIAFLLPSLRGGGAERVFVRLSGEAAARGYDADLVLVERTGPLVESVSSRVRVVDLRARRVAAAVPALARYLRRERPDALIAAMSHTNLLALAARSVARVDTRVVVSLRTVFSEAQRHSKLRRARVLPWLMRRAYPHADGIVAVSRWAADDLSEHLGVPRESIEVIYNPIDLDQVQRAAAEPPPHPWFQPGEPPVVLGAGRFVPAKDFETLLRAFARVRQKRPSRLVVLGEGTQRAMLEALADDLGIAEEVAFPGFHTNPHAFMARAGVFVLSSRWDGMPNALIEALACGTPVVSTHCPGGSAEILEDGRWGPLVPVGDPEALAEAIVRTLDAPMSREALRARAGHFALDRIATEYLKAMLPSTEGEGPR